MFEKPWHQLAIDFISNPCETRTIKQFCDEIGIDPATYYRFTKNNSDDIYTQVDKERKKYHREMRAEAMKALFSRLKKSDKAIELFFKLTGELIERTESRIEYMTPDQKRERIRKALDALVKKKEKEDINKGQGMGDGVGT
jgi:signal recognition particle GTPase